MRTGGIIGSPIREVKTGKRAWPRKFQVRLDLKPIVARNCATNRGGGVTRPRYSRDFEGEFLFGCCLRSPLVKRKVHREVTMKKLAILMTAAMIVSGTAVAADKVRMGTEGAYPPFNQIDASGKLTGFDVEIGNALCEQMKADCEWVTQDWDGIIPGLLAKKYDTIIASMSITDERKQAVDFTDRYYSNSLRYIAKKGSGLDVMKLDGKTIGAQRATIAAIYLEDNMAGKVDIKLYDTQENAYIDLAAERLDAVLGDMLVNYEWLQSDAGKGFEFVGESFNRSDQIGIAVRKGEDDLREKLNAAIKVIIDNGTYAKINAKYFPFSIY